MHLADDRRCGDLHCAPARVQISCAAAAKQKSFRNLVRETKDDKRGGRQPSCRLDKLRGTRELGMTRLLKVKSESVNENPFQTAAVFMLTGREGLASLG